VSYYTKLSCSARAAAAAEQSVWCRATRRRHFAWH